MNHNEFNILKIVKNLKSIEQQKRGSYHCTKHNKYRISTIISNREATGNLQKKGYIEYTFVKSFNLKQNTKKVLKWAFTILSIQYIQVLVTSVLCIFKYELVLCPVLINTFKTTQFVFKRIH